MIAGVLLLSVIFNAWQFYDAGKNQAHIKQLEQSLSDCESIKNKFYAEVKNRDETVAEYISELNRITARNNTQQNELEALRAGSGSVRAFDACVIPEEYVMAIGASSAD